ncbi:hypothetical protein IU433_14835 [Nocardia puris]|uniref:hypothetical protein n=1 Tax=Nocardia puris TaxID=208602 RepID=UPI00189518A6|nr:hypothetical protein [Nocardia puris]MBF6214634.1 hypothetical protein [Nocardia puris]MBF6366043.1 hypothetical protein [Nocardia puris]MBF6460314.1 hypothetical protein [Nocardia puris]
MSNRAFRDTFTPAFAGLEKEVIYRIPGVPREFVVEAETLANLICKDCSVPILVMADKKSGRAIRAWHDETCPTAREESKVKPRILHRQR